MFIMMNAITIEIVSSTKVPFRTKDKLFFRAGKIYHNVEQRVAEYLIGSGFAVKVG
jgi:hypothetical protein